ncbi:MBL fold metallo-hydrolase [Candidatus Peribacteria bacterium]|nr:MBL fold metallo-hydrolase [Candidatus Peribacteria bacterium]
MRIEFSGAAQNVTGSKHLLHINGKKVLLDCGLFQGRRTEADTANRHFPFDADELDAVVLSHAHIDHSGLLPLLAKYGYTGPIYSTHATRDLCSIMLPDAAHIQESDYDFIKLQQQNPEVEPLYDMQDAEKTMTLFRSVEFGQAFSPVPGMEVTFHDAGHILGAAMEEITLQDDDTGQTVRLGFTGDLGRRDIPILKNPKQLRDLDVLITESTYGNRNHDEIRDVEGAITEKIRAVAERGGKIIIPAFAVGRTQEVLYIFREMQRAGTLPDIPIFVDSPLAVRATEIFRLHRGEFDAEFQRMLESGIAPFAEVDGVHYITDVEESKKLIDFPGSCIIISASGMCEAGRIKHHLANHMGDPKNLVLVVGFMAENTLGRKIVDGEKVVNIFGNPYEVRAEVMIVRAFSGHAGHDDLLRFADRTGSPQQLFLVHGESDVMQSYMRDLGDLKSLQRSYIAAPCPGEIWELGPEKSWRRTAELNPVSARYMPATSYCMLSQHYERDDIALPNTEQMTENTTLTSAKQSRHTRATTPKLTPKSAKLTHQQRDYAAGHNPHYVSDNPQDTVQVGGDIPWELLSKRERKRLRGKISSRKRFRKTQRTTRHAQRRNKYRRKR